jgi:hypothetical protein
MLKKTDPPVMQRQSSPGFLSLGRPANMMIQGHLSNFLLDLRFPYGCYLQIFESCVRFYYFWI